MEGHGEAVSLCGDLISKVAAQQKPQSTIMGVQSTLHHLVIPAEGKVASLGGRVSEAEGGWFDAVMHRQPQMQPLGTPEAVEQRCRQLLSCNALQPGWGPLE